MSGNDSRKTSGSKNVSRTSGQPGLVRISEREAAEDDDASRRRRSPARGAPARRRAAARSARRSWAPSAVGGRGGYSRTGALVASLIHCFSIAGSSPDALSSSIAAETQSVSGESFSSSAPHSSPPGRRELADRGRLGHLHRGQEERGRDVDDDRVDLLVLERADDVVGGVEDLRLVARLDHVVDRVEAGGPDLDPDLGVGEVGERGRVGGVGVLERDDRLLGLVVGRREVDLLGALRRDRDLVDVEVEVLRPRRVGGVERARPSTRHRPGRSRAGRRSHRRRRSRSPCRWSGRCPRSRAGRQACRSPRSACRGFGVSSWSGVQSSSETAAAVSSSSLSNRRRCRSRRTTASATRAESRDATRILDTGLDLGSGGGTRDPKRSVCAEPAAGDSRARADGADRRQRRAGQGRAAGAGRRARGARLGRDRRRRRSQRAHRGRLSRPGRAARCSCSSAASSSAAPARSSGRSPTSAT